MKDWRTTTASVAGAIVLIASQIVNLFDNDPETVFSMEAIIAALALLGVGILAKDAKNPGE